MPCPHSANSALVLLVLLSSPSFALPHFHWLQLWSRSSSLSKRGVPDAGYYSPLAANGSMLTVVPVTWPAGQGEPLNMIISGKSDERVLVDQQDNGGLKNFFLSLQFSTECLGQHLGSHQGANLGYGNGLLNETEVIRYNYGDPYLGACTETVKGGNHFRYWVQNGDSANSGAVFMACSYELPVDLGHDIVRDGYNLARDYIVGNITGVTPSPSQTWPTNTTTYTGQTFFEGWVYDVDVKYVPGLSANTSDGVNHQYTVAVNGRAAMDGLVAVLTVKVNTVPANATRSVPPQADPSSTIDSSSTSAATSVSYSLTSPSLLASIITLFLVSLSPLLFAFS